MVFTNNDQKFDLNQPHYILMAIGTTGKGINSLITGVKKASNLYLLTFPKLQKTLSDTLKKKKVACPSV
jgi:hypothetical protein